MKQTQKINLYFISFAVITAVIIILFLCEPAFAGGLEKFINKDGGKKILTQAKGYIEGVLPGMVGIGAVLGSIATPGDLRTRAMAAGIGGVVALLAYQILDSFILI